MTHSRVSARNDNMVTHLKLPLRFDTQRLQRDLAAVENTEWICHFVHQHYEGCWSVIPLRCQADARHPVMMIYSDPACGDWVDSPYLEGCSYFQQVLESFQCPLEAVRLMRLAPGSVIKPHRDHDLSLEHGHVRLHIPVTTNPDVVFSIGNTEIFMAEGECWYLRFSEEHSVRNSGKTDRVHIVVDAVVNNWLLGFFRKLSTPTEDQTICRI